MAVGSRLDTVRAVTELTVGTGDHDGAHAGAGVPGEDTAGTGGFVVRMCVYCHQRRTIRHAASPPVSTGPAARRPGGPAARLEPGTIPAATGAHCRDTR